MRDHYTYEYAVIRVVPRVEREEFVNAGVILWCASHKFIEARIELDEGRLRTLDPTLEDESIQSIRAHLASIIAICRGGEEAGPIGRLSESERFHWLVAPRSTIIQTSPVHTGRCDNPAAVIERLLETMVRPPCAESPNT